MDRIQLYNRYRDKIYLDRIDESWWKLCGTNLDYCRYGFDNNGVNFVDPSGGPFMMIDTFSFEDNHQKYILKQISIDNDIIKMKFENGSK